MGGHVGCAAPREGSLFWFSVRLKKDHNSHAAAARRRCRDRRPEHCPPLAGRVLLAEDDEINREVALALLEESGLLIDMAENGEEAVSAAENDGLRPDPDGHADAGHGWPGATRRIRQLPGDGTPIIALTANAFAEDRQRCMEAGMNDFVAKPIDPSHLFEKIFHWLSQGR
jgi:CheY-like chemotaxis protein